MPLARLALLIVCVIVAAAVTVWLLTQGGAGVMIAALPAFMIAAVAFKLLRK
jgi:hypothetical protein